MILGTSEIPGGILGLKICVCPAAVPFGGTTRLFSVFEKPPTVPTSGRVKVEVFAMRKILPEPIEDKWPW
ncbi:hypothetical protein, conserved [Eimeria maxima]|uniref:Uncharacterized protein n=1 Tax=Eimeria maxima TaxID=5804 RepID=U6M7K1_EIMMA|nr:hypothetical protein, conserved [Eimeria maxima]CDJ60192.1 hypothetical protein, conserved [Eimeria maxima]